MSFLPRPSSILTLFALAASALISFAQSDDFNDGNDTGWTRFNPLSVVGVTPQYSFPSDGWGGKAYRMLSPAPPVSDAGPARAFSYQTTQHTDFYAAVDIIAWDNTLNQAFGILFRASNIGLGKTLGYVFNYDPNQASGGRGQIQINLVTDEKDNGTIGSSNLSLEPGQRYRFVLSALGPDFTAKVYDLRDLTAPVTIFHASDSTYAKGILGLFNFYRGSAITDPVAGKADCTFDNYFAAALPPSNVPAPGIAQSMPGMPQVISRSPASFANFASASNGIAFTATTLSTNVIDPNKVRLFLNGAEVLLSYGGTSNNVTASYKGLAPNTVYNAQAIAGDAEGRATTNQWTFDTFSEAFLSSAQAKVIEAEDYNFDGGKFIDNPPPSGADVAGAIINSGTGYYDQAGIPEIDYHDLASSPGGGATAEYRTSDFVGTQAGSSETAANSVDDPPLNDTIRQKYAVLNLPEYEVRRTEGGEWLNYTRNFSNGTYNVYLRAASRAPQSVTFARVNGDPSTTNQTITKLGSFSIPGDGVQTTYRYTQLKTSGTPAAVTLSGLQTLRLSFDPPAQSATQYTMALNYMLFVPAISTGPDIQVESAARASGPFSPDATATVATGRITIPIQPGATRFFQFQLSDSVASKFAITGARREGANLVVDFQQ